MFNVSDFGTRMSVRLSERASVEFRGRKTHLRRVFGAPMLISYCRYMPPASGKLNGSPRSKVNGPLLMLPLLSLVPFSASSAFFAVKAVAVYRRPKHAAQARRLSVRLLLTTICWGWGVPAKARLTTNGVVISPLFARAKTVSKTRQKRSKTFKFVQL